jgi:hypothetical protein
MKALSSDQVQQIYRSASALNPSDRDAFFSAVLTELQGREIVGDGTIFLVCKEAQAKFWRPPPLLGHGPHHGHKFE